MIELDAIYHGDGLAMLLNLPAESVDMIFADLPYGATELEWDEPISLSAFWAAVNHAAKPKAAIVFTAQQPYASELVTSNRALFRHEWVWTDNRPSNPYLANVGPLRVHESILVFGKQPAAYYPHMTAGARKTSPGDDVGFSATAGRTPRLPYDSDKRYPTSILKIGMPNDERGRHPTQKPLALLDYLITTYTQPGELVADPCIGSGSSIVAAMRAGRRFVGADTELRFVQSARAWLDEPYTPKLFAGSAS